MPHPDFASARHFAIGQLTSLLAPEIAYHSLAHTVDEVVPAVDRMILAEGVENTEKQLLLRTAALFHDLGYTSTQLNHEALSATIASQALPEYGYTRPQIETIQAMIMATRLPQNPQDVLQQILADADLDLLGSHNFFTRNMDLRKEMDVFQGPVSDVTWYTNQIAFLQDHCYFTRSTRELREPTKQQNLVELHRRLVLAQKADSLGGPDKMDRADRPK